MKPKPLTTSFIGIMVLLLLNQCSKDSDILVDDNDAPYNDAVPTVVINNYVNRLFIDLLGREPLDTELATETEYLKARNLSVEARDTLVTKLQSDTSYIAGDSSYRHAYYWRMYENFKARCIDGASDADIQGQIGIYQFAATSDSLNGDSAGLDAARANILRTKQLLRVRTQYPNGQIHIGQCFARMANNFVFDEINMNTFNFVNATFDNLLYRYPTQVELLAGMQMIDDNTSQNIFGRNGQNKADYIEIFITSREFHEGCIMWAFQSLLARFPTTEEINSLMDDFYNTRNFQLVQKHILIGDEYANF